MKLSEMRPSEVAVTVTNAGKIGSSLDYLSYVIHDGGKPRGDQVILKHQYRPRRLAGSMRASGSIQHRLVLLDQHGDNLMLGEWVKLTEVATVDLGRYLGFTEKTLGEGVVEVARRLPRVSS